MSGTLKRGTAPGAVAQVQAGTIGPPAGPEAVGAPSSDANGSQCASGGSVSSSMRVYTNIHTWAASGNQAHVAAGQPPRPPPPPPPPPLVSSFPGAAGVALNRCRDLRTSCLLAGHTLATGSAQCDLPSQIQSSCSVDNCILGVTAQQIPSAVSRIAPEAASHDHLYPQTPARGPSAFPGICPTALLSGQKGTRKYSLGLDGYLSTVCAAGEQPRTSQSTTKPALNSSPSHMGATNVSDSAHSSAVAANDVKQNNLTKAAAPPAVRRVPLAATFPAIAATLGGGSDAGATVPRQINSFALTARHVLPFQIPCNAVAAPYASKTAASRTPVASAAVTGGSPTFLPSSIVGGLAPTSRKDCEGEVVSVQQQEHRVHHRDVQAAESCKSTAAAGNPMRNISLCSYDAASASAITTVNSVASYPAIHSAAIAATTSHPTTATAATGAVDAFVKTTGGAESAAFDPFLHLKTSTLNAAVMQASLGARRTALRGHLEQFQNSLQAAYSVAAAGASTTPACQTVQKASGTAASTIATGDAAAAATFPSPAASSAAPTGAADPVAAHTVADAGRRSASGNSATVTPRSSRAAAAATVASTAAGFLQRTKRVPREGRRPPRRYFPYDMTYQPDCFSPGFPARLDGRPSHLVGDPFVSPLSASCASTSPATSAALPTGGISSVASSARTTAIITQDIPTVVQHPVNFQACDIGPGVYFPSKATAVNAAFRTPQPQEKPPWRTLTPEQLLLQRTSKKRPLGGSSSSLRGVTPFLKPATDVPPRLAERALNSSSKELDTEASAEGISAKAGRYAVVAGQPTSTGKPRQPPAVAVGAAGVVTEPLRDAETAGEPLTQRPITSAEIGALAAAAENTTAADSGMQAAGASSDASPVGNSSHQSSAGVLASVAADAVRYNNERRRTRKPSRLSLEAAESYNLTVAFRQQRRSSGRANKSNFAARSDTATSFTPRKTRVNAGIDGDDLATSCLPVAAPEEVHRQRPRRQGTKTKRLRAGSLLKRQPVPQRHQQQECPGRPHLLDQMVEDEWTHLTSLQQEEAAEYAAALQKKPVCLDSCRFTLCPPGFASFPAAVRHVCLSGTLQQPVYVPSAASLSSVQHTLEWQQQETVAAATKCRAKFSHVAVKRLRADAGGTGSRKSGVTNSGTRIHTDSNEPVGSATVGGGEAEMRNAPSSKEKTEGSVVGFTENSTVSGYIYHWYTRMHVSAQLETQLQQLLKARERLAQQLHDGSEMHSNLFFFSLFPQDYGIEQFKQNLRFFPQYSVAAAAAEAAGLQPLVLYADSSCTAAIAESTRRAKLVEQLYETERLQQLQLLAEVEAQSQNQQQQDQDVPPQPEPQQGTHKKKTALPEATQQQQVRERDAPDCLLKSTEIKEEHHAGLGLTVAQGEQECTELHNAGFSEILEEKITSLLDGRVAPEVTGCKVESSALATARNIAAVTSAASSDGPASNAAETAKCKTDEWSSFAETRTAGVHVDSGVLPIPVGNHRLMEPDTNERDRQTEHTGEGDDKKEVTANGHAHTAAGVEETAANASVPQCTSGKYPAVLRATAKEFKEEGRAASKARESDDLAQEQALARLESGLVHVKESNSIWKDEDSPVKKEPDSGIRECLNTTRSECACEHGPVSGSMSDSCSLEKMVLTDDCCASRPRDVDRICSSFTTEVRHDTDCSCSRRSSTYDNSSCDGASNVNATDDRGGDSIKRCSSNNTCSSIGGKEETDNTRSTTVEKEYRSSSNRSDSSKNTSAAANRTCVASRRLSGNNTPGAIGSSCSNGSTDLRDDQDSVSLKHSSTEDEARDTMGGGGAISSTLPDITPCNENISQRTADSDCTTRPVGDVTARLAPLPTNERSSDRGRSECESSESGSQNNATAESLAEARYFPIIPRVGTVDIASTWKLIHAAEQLLLELHQRQQQEEAPPQLEEQLPSLVESLPDWWMDSVDWSMEQQLTALMLRRVLPGLAAWQGRDLRLCAAFDCLLLGGDDVFSRLLTLLRIFDERTSASVHVSVSARFAPVPKRMRVRSLANEMKEGEIVGTVLPFAARGLLALALCQLEHRITMLQQQLAAAVGALQVLVASVLLLQTVEEYYAPPLYSLPQHVLACLYSRGGGRSVMSPSARKRPIAREKLHGFTYNSQPQKNVEAVAYTGPQIAGGVVSSEEAHKGGGGENEEECVQNQESGGQEKADARALPSWESGIKQGAPVAVGSFVAYADAFEDYLPTLDKGKASSVLPVLATDSEEGLPAPERVRTVPDTGRSIPRRGAAPRSATCGKRVKTAVASGTKRGRRRKLAANCGESGTNDGNRHSGNNSTTGATLKFDGRSTTEDKNSSPSARDPQRASAVLENDYGLSGIAV